MFERGSYIHSFAFKTNAHLGRSHVCDSAHGELSLHTRKTLACPDSPHSAFKQKEGTKKFLTAALNIKIFQFIFLPQLHSIK